MAWKGRKNKGVDFSNLLSSLNAAKLQSENPMLYQTIKGLIDKSQQSTSQVNQTLNTFIGDIDIEDSADLQAILNAISTINAFLADGTFLTYLDESISLPSSRQLVEGLGVDFDDTVAFQRILNILVDGITIQVNGSNQLEVISSPTSSADYVVASDGATPSPSPMDDGFGSFMYILYTP